MKENSIISKIEGTLIPAAGNDLDTDRIIPARFLRCTTFDDLGGHVFEDDRKESENRGDTHPFDDSKFAGAGILVVNENFGCGSSREHAPQALMRWGIKALVGQSFAEIFFGNCVSMGIPCVRLTPQEVSELQTSATESPSIKWTLDIEKETLSGSRKLPVMISIAAKSQFLSGTWNPMAGLLMNMESVKKTAERLPYLKDFNGV